MEPTGLSVGTLICVEIDKRGRSWAGSETLGPVQSIDENLMLQLLPVNAQFLKFDLI